MCVRMLACIEIYVCRQLYEIIWLLYTRMKNIYVYMYVFLYVHGPWGLHTRIRIIINVNVLACMRNHVHV